MTYINITKFVLVNELEKDHSMVETRRLKNVVIFIQIISKSLKKGNFMFFSFDIIKYCNFFAHL